MSTVVDDGLGRRLQDGAPEEVYDAISQELSRTYRPYMDIELLPRGYETELGSSFFVKKGHRLAIPKSRLVQAFAVARRILLASHLDEPGRTCASDVRRATSVMLLLDSEHLTAANARKRLLGQTRPANERETQLKREMYFVNSLLSSHLHRHAKSPILWAHKHWLLRQYAEARIPMDLRHDFESVIHVAAERHPKNYYAWTYARDLFASRAKVHARCWDAQQDEDLVQMTAGWCRRHHDDISGWSFLLRLALESPRHAHDMFRQTATLVRTYSWRGESVWNFLRNLVLVPALRDDSEIEHSFVDLWQHVRQDVQHVQALDAKVLDRAADWVGIPSCQRNTS
ncbi:Protein prenyltransferase [Metarhizium album ARSEF 1941]|uniref:Protein prenyltransferase n=1 Tax=Metarhizium album (strain ARSEF 1941) TaxID=1081103 RepID=A0A0B2WUL7_METAS|nr:Protein prenyltransferase [Metarhizium album ARSEF 1941]KHN97753.1 Protein prenyltransferase [Metarhizium album ARSEF 1941]